MIYILFFIMRFTFPATEPGVPYNITVRASTAAGKGEPVSIVVFSVQQGNIQMTVYVYVKDHAVLMCRLAILPQCTVLKVTV